VKVKGDGWEVEAFVQDADSPHRWDLFCEGELVGEVVQTGDAFKCDGATFPTLMAAMRHVLADIVRARS
jgi:hypothetical protein